MTTFRTRCLLALTDKPMFRCPLCCDKLRPEAGRRVRFVDGLRAFVCWRHPRAKLAGVR